MKTRVTVMRAALLVAGFGLPACQINITDNDNSDVVVSEAFSFSIDAAGRNVFRLDGINGTVHVLGDANATFVTVGGVKEAGAGNTSDADRLLERLEVRITTGSSEIRVETIPPSDLRGRHQQVDYDIIVPIDMRVEVRNINGEIEIVTLDRDVEVVSTNGNVTVLDIFASVEVAVTNGNVVAEVFLPQNGLVDIVTTNGNITLDVPDDVSAMLQADVTNGAISVRDLQLSDPTISARSVRATLRDGGGLIDLDTTNGSIQIRGFVP